MFSMIRVVEFLWSSCCYCYFTVISCKSFEYCYAADQVATRSVDNGNITVYASLLFLIMSK